MVFSAAAASFTAGDLAAILTVAITLSGIASAWFASRLRRRSQSGTVGTSQADSLWTAANALIASYQAENAKLINQRDVLIASFDRMLPVQEANGKMLTELLAMAGQFKNYGATAQDTLEAVAGNTQRLEAVCAQLDDLLASRLGREEADPLAVDSPDETTSPPAPR